MQRIACDEMSLNRVPSGCSCFGKVSADAVAGDVTREEPMNKAAHGSKLAHDNELLTQTGPGTPGGALLRRYWQPVALAEELPAGGAPPPVTMLGGEGGVFR